VKWVSSALKNNESERLGVNCVSGDQKEFGVTMTALRNDSVSAVPLTSFAAASVLGSVDAAQSSNSSAGLSQTGSEAYRSGIAGSVSQSSTQVLDRFLNIPPTVTIREGHRVKVYFTQDLLLPAYASPYPIAKCWVPANARALPQA
jgi:Bacterial conjugation TrbI-like protein